MVKLRKALRDDDVSPPAATNCLAVSGNPKFKGYRRKRLVRVKAAEKMLASRQSTPINPEETGNEPETKNPGTSRTEDGDMMEEYIWIGRTGRRNAMGYIWTRDAETRLLDLPDLIKGLSTVTVTDQPLIARQDPNAPGMSR
ncbi:uncharacterized protein LOC143368143 isoform X1 [Andrena cerasifolii]|uniref:uncharacterized protein LOC143368143 isoform X1 n=1 Tax=Andrena cerasifolii TaxID=2819439 RepID=UPI0040377EA4